MVAARALSLVERRRLPLASLPAHDVELRPLLPSARGDGFETGMIVSAAEQDFIGAVMADLQSPAWRERLRLRQVNRRASDAIAELYQPVSQRFYLVLLEAACVQPGHPRLDPRKLGGQGLVLRRLAETWEQGQGWQGWISAGPARRGWLSVAADADPDPAQRRSVPTSGHAAIDALIRANRGGTQLTEDVLPLFVAPPGVCDVLGKTVLYGLVPLASSELSEAGAAAPDFAAEADADGGALRQHLSGYLKARPLLAMPHAGDELSDTWADPAASALSDASAADADTSLPGRLKAFNVLLQQLTMELGAFDATPAAQALMALLATVTLPLKKDSDGRVIEITTAAEFLPHAVAVLLQRQKNTAHVKMPLEWPAIDAPTGERLTQAALACMSARFAHVKPQTGKFDGTTRRYAVRGFIRVVRDDGCPPKLVWSNNSEAFRILPWYASDAPPAQVPLPDVTDRNVLQSLKPGVAFQLPPTLANLLRGDPNDLVKGTGNTGGLTIGWLCSFSIPIITICAFIVLNIFLSLFDLIFRWMMFIKICVPYPKRGGD